MKKIIIILSIFILLVSSQSVYAGIRNCAYDNDNCSALIENIRSQKNTLYNVLNLSPSQQAVKDEIETRRISEMQPLIDEYKLEKQKLHALIQNGCSKKEIKEQHKITSRAHKKIHKTFKKYDKEFMKILCRQQRSKYREINKLIKRDLRYCRLNRRSCPKNPYINTFGKQDAKPACCK